MPISPIYDTLCGFRVISPSYFVTLERSHPTTIMASSPGGPCDHSDRPPPTGVYDSPLFVDLPAEGDSLSCDCDTDHDIVTVNELLCFVTNKIDVMTQDVLVKICADFYDGTSIVTAKKLLYEQIQALNLDITLPRFAKRKGPNRNKSDILDIIRLCHEVGSSVPVFVARDLSSLPTVSANCFDMALLMRDIEAMKLQLLVLADMATVSRQIVAAVETITKDRPVVDATHQPVDGPCIVPTVDKNDALLHDNVDDEVGIIAADGSNPAVSSPTFGRADVEVCVRSEVDPPTDAEDATASTIADVRDPPAAPRPRQKDGSSKTLAQVVASSPPPIDSRGFQHVTRQRRKNRLSYNGTNGIASPINGNGVASSNNAHPRVSKSHYSQTHVIGSGRQDATCGIQAAQRHGRQSVTGGLFVSRVAANTSASSLRRYIKDCCGVNAKCYAIKTKFDSYSSFRVLADAHLEKLLEPSIWPAGVLIRDFV